MTPRAQRDEIFLNVISQSAARAEVVELKILRHAAALAAPPIARCIEEINSDRRLSGNGKSHRARRLFGFHR
jgi:hypothetical protein